MVEYLGTSVAVLLFGSLPLVVGAIFCQIVKWYR